MTLRRTAISCSLLSFSGFVLAGYLSFLHIALLRGELLGGPLCGGAGSFFNCHAVAASRFSSFLGVPVSFWGVFAYLILLTLSFIALKFPELSRQALTAIAALAGACLLLDLGLLWVMLAKIRALCSLCLLMVGIKGLILLTAKRGLGRRWNNLFKPMPSFWLPLLSPVASAAGWMLGMVAVTGLAGILAVQFSTQYLSRAPDGLRDRILHRMQTAPRVAVDAGDSPRIGLGGAPVQVVMFTDPLCPLCREAAEFNEIALKAYRGKISLVTKQFPLDTRAFQACLAAGHPKESVLRDLEEGKRLGVVATPTFFVNGVKILGAITPAQFDEIIRQEENSPFNPARRKS